LGRSGGRPVDDVGGRLVEGGDVCAGGGVTIGVVDGVVRGVVAFEMGVVTGTEVTVGGVDVVPLDEPLGDVTGVVTVTGGVVGLVVSVVLVKLLVGRGVETTVVTGVVGVTEEDGVPVVTVIGRDTVGVGLTGVSSGVVGKVGVVSVILRMLLTIEPMGFGGIVKGVVEVTAGVVEVTAGVDEVEMTAGVVGDDVGVELVDVTTPLGPSKVGEGVEDSVEVEVTELKVEVEVTVELEVGNVSVGMIVRDGCDPVDPTLLLLLPLDEVDVPPTTVVTVTVSVVSPVLDESCDPWLEESWFPESDDEVEGLGVGSGLSGTLSSGVPAVKMVVGSRLVVCELDPTAGKGCDLVVDEFVNALLMCLGK
jgi:hypothetical protein